MISSLTPTDVWRQVAHSMVRDSNAPATTVVSQLARRLSSFLCPCSRSIFQRTLSRSIRDLLPGDLQPQEMAEDIVEMLLVGGDLLELSETSICAPETSGPQLFAAPPTFVIAGDVVWLLGVAPDDAPALPESLEARVMYRGASRYLAEASDDAVQALERDGWICLPQAHWLHREPEQSAHTFVDRLTSRLAAAPEFVHDYQNLQVLSPASSSRCPYRSRWRPPTDDEVSLRIFRAAQAYGAPAWFAGLFQAGQARQALQLPLAATHERACDVAWRCQLAIDATAGLPAGYRTLPYNAGKVLVRFDFPVPLTVARRLRYLGLGHETSDPYAFVLPGDVFRAEEPLLQRELWVTQHE